jgi:hypothetical protein
MEAGQDEDREEVGDGVEELFAILPVSSVAWT